MMPKTEGFDKGTWPKYGLARITLVTLVSFSICSVEKLLAEEPRATLSPTAKPGLFLHEPGGSKSASSDQSQNLIQARNGPEKSDLSDFEPDLDTAKGDRHQSFDTRRFGMASPSDHSGAVNGASYNSSEYERLALIPDEEFKRNGIDKTALLDAFKAFKADKNSAVRVAGVANLLKQEQARQAKNRGWSLLALFAVFLVFLIKRLSVSSRKTAEKSKT